VQKKDFLVSPDIDSPSN